MCTICFVINVFLVENTENSQQVEESVSNNVQRHDGSTLFVRMYDGIFLGYLNILKYIYTNLNSFILGTKYVNCHRAKVVENVHFKKVHEHKVIFRLCNDI